MLSSTFAAHALTVQDELYGSCAYFVVNCAEGIAFEQAQLLMVTLVDLFESIPHDDRKDVYTKAIADVYTYPVEVKKEGKDPFAIKVLVVRSVGRVPAETPSLPCSRACTCVSLLSRRAYRR